MTQEEKKLLLIDLCARLPYGVKLRYVEDLVVKKEPHIITLNNIYLEHILNGDADIKPYLRPMSSMTEKEKLDYVTLGDILRYGNPQYAYLISEQLDYLNANHFDYHGLIDKGLALEALKGMYKK